MPMDPETNVSISAREPTAGLVPDHELLRRVARGSYGEVWLARNIMGVYRAVKIIRQESFERARPFERELAGLQRFEPVSRSHESLVQILHAGWLPDDAGFFYVMELADDDGGGGEIQPETYQPRTLRREIDRRGALPVPECLDVAISLTGALHFLHERGLLHRDLKPSNVIFVGSRAKLADIGLVAESSESRSLVGTEGFLPAEGVGTPQADIYALGKLIYEMMTGRDRLEYPTLPASWVGDPARQPQIELMEIVYQACDEDWRRRHASAAALKADLALLQSGQSVRRVRGLERRVRRMARAGLVVAATTVVAVGAWGLTESARRAEQTARERIERAEAEAQRRLAEAQFARIRAGRHSGRSGCRFDPWAALQETVNHGRSMELRNEAAAVLALADLRVIPWPKRRDQTAAFARNGGLTEWLALREGGFRPFSPDGIPLSEPIGADRGRAEQMVPLDSQGRFMAVWTTRGRLDVWDVESRELLLDLAAPDILDVPVLEESSGRLAVQGRGNQVVLYNLPERAEIAQWSAEFRPNTFAWRPGRETLALYSRSSPVVLLVDPMSGAVRGRVSHPDMVMAITWSPDGDYLATTSSDRLVRVWEPRPQEPLLLRTGRGHLNAVVGVAWHPQGDLLVTTSWDGTTRLWDAPSLGLLAVEQGWGIRPRFSQDGGKLVLDLPDEGRSTLLEVEAGRVCRHLVEPELPTSFGNVVGPRSVAMDTTGSTLATASADGIRLWSAVTGKRTDYRLIRACRSVAFPSGDSLFVAGSTGAAVLPLTRAGGGGNGAGALRIPSDGRPGVLSSKDVWTGAVAVAEWGPVFSWIEGTTVIVRRQENESRIPVAMHPCAAVPDPRGNRVAVGFFLHDSGIQMWDAETRQLLWETTGGLRRPHLTFSPDGRWVVVGGIHEVSFRDAETGEPGPSIPRADGADLAAPVAFSPDGRWLAMAWSRTVARLYEVATMRELVTLECPLPFIISGFAFDPARRYLAVSTEGHVTHLWDLTLLRERLSELGLDWEDGDD